MRSARVLVPLLLCAGMLPAQPGAKPPLTVVMFGSWRDPNEGAFTLNVPRNWQISGGANRRAAVDIRHIVRATEPSGRIHIYIDDPNIIPRQVPEPMSMRMGMGEGRIVQGAWGGPLLIARYRTGAEFSREYARRLCPNAEFTGGGDLQRETADMMQQVRAYAAQTNATAHATVGDVYYRCGTQLGYVTATTVLAGPPRMQGGVQVWVVLTMSGFTVERPVDAPYAMYILHNMTASFRLDPQWEARSQRDTAALTQAVTRMQNAMMADLKQQWAAQADRERASVVSKDKGFDVMSGWEARNKIMDKTLEKDTEVRRGVTTTEDPVWGSRTVANDYNYYWTRPDGSIIGTNTDSTPRVDGGGWRLMGNH